MATSSRLLSRLLVVDDEKDNLQALGRLLRKDFEIVTATSGEEGLERFATAGPFDVVVSDQRMPGIQGSEFLERVRAIDAMPTRILLTGFSDVEAVVEAVNRGQIWRYISKPWEPEDLRQTLRAAAERCQMQKSITRYQSELERAVTELRAKDWARERLLRILLHEFRTAPQILGSLRELDAGGDDAPARMRFIENLERRFGILETDLLELLEDEKKIATLDRATVPSAQLRAALVEALGEPLLLAEPESNDAPGFFVHLDTVTAAFRHLRDVIAKNTAGTRPRLKVERLGSTTPDLYFVFEIKGNGSWPMPEGLKGQKIDVQVAWKALLEPFVGSEDFAHHSTGLRLTTARHVRALAGQGFKSEFNFVAKDHAVELILHLQAQP